MGEQVRIVTVDNSNLEEEGFFCYKSKPASAGYLKKQAWLSARMKEGLRIKILYEGKRSMAFIEYAPGEHAWRVVHAPEHLVIHCLWVVGKGKKKGYATRLLDACFHDAEEQGKLGVAMISSRGNWLAGDKVFLKNGFERLADAPPSFQLLVKQGKPGPKPAFPGNWEERCQRYPDGATLLYADQCPYTPDAIAHVEEAFQARSLPLSIIRLENREDLMERSPSAYGVFGIVVRGQLFTYHYLGKKELRRLDEEFLV